MEAGPPPLEPAAWRELLGQHQLAYLGMIFVDNAQQFAAELKKIAAYEPVMVCVHALRDRTPFADGCAFLAEALKIEADIGIPVAHETHRGRMLCNPWVTAAYAEKFGDLKFCADFSHFVNVCESLLANMDDLLAPVIAKSIQIHARVGWEQGPQVPDPRAPEWAEHVAAHEGGWDRIHAARRAAGAEMLAVDPEFGGVPYLPLLPYTRQPMVDLWEVRKWMMERLRARWADR